MKIKTFNAPTEQEAIAKVMEDMGSGAIILTIKKIKPKGIFKFFRKEKVEVTAATDEGVIKAERRPAQAANVEQESPLSAEKKIYNTASSDNFIKDVKISERDVRIQEQEETIKNLEKIISNNEELMKKIVNQFAEQAQTTGADTVNSKFENAMVQLFYETLVKNGVNHNIALRLVSDLDTYFDDDDTNISMLVKLIYNRILQLLGEPRTINIKKGNLVIAVFIGPTGVGKTTTIAKLASHLIINENMRVGLVTADTYRIAAVEQLKTYGSILDIDVEIVYNSADLKDSINKVSRFNDVIFIDTAGRSHRNEESLMELKELLSVIPGAELYLLLSTTTKYEDLLAISKVYERIGEYTIILTKLDESGNFGSALNLRYDTGKRISYLTDGQNVPEDIVVAEPAIIARSLLGSFDS